MESSFKFKGYDFLYFDEGVPYYSLFRNSRKLNSFWEVKYVAEVLLYLNPSLSKKLFTYLMTELTDRSSGHTVRTYSSDKIQYMCEYTYDNPKQHPYVRRYRKLIFNPSKVIPIDEKRAIVGKVIGGRKRNYKITEEKLYSIIEKLCDTSKLITYVKLASYLGCTRQTVSKHITNSLKEIIDYHNNHC